MRFTDKLQHAWNIFVMNKDPTIRYNSSSTGGTYYRPDRPRFTYGNERSIISSVYNRISLDTAAVNIQHVRLDDNDRFTETIKSKLNKCLTLDANIDQTGRAFMQDVVMSLLDEGCIAIVPIDTNFNPNIVGGYEILSMRTGKIVEWFPSYVKVNVYNDKSGKREDVLVDKKMVAIIENPFHAVMNEPNSTLKRLVRKINLLDVVDEQNGSGKFNMIIQLPYVIKTETRQKQAEERRLAIEDQLVNSKYGIAYMDGTEKITQLNRPLDNSLMGQIEYLTTMLYSQLGLTQAIMDGTADAATMLNYYNRTIEPILSAITDEMKRKFLTETARTQMQSIMYFRDPFKLVPVNELADISDKFTRNEILSSNEMRGIIGYKPSKDPKADELRNKNITQPSTDEINNTIPTDIGDKV